MRVPTVYIESEAGPVRINKSDFNPEKHTLFEGKLGSAAVEPAPAEVTLTSTEPQPASAVSAAAIQTALRDDGPTIAQFVEAGYDPNTYPPNGYNSRSTSDEIAAAVIEWNARQSNPAGDNAGSTPAPDAERPLVAQFGDRFFIVNAVGDKLSDKGISPTGYASNEKAWEAVGKLGAAE